MTWIKVDYRSLETAASAIDSYISKHKSNMNKIDRAVTSLGGSWQGKDYNQLNIEWNEIKSSGSSSGKMIKALESYADFLRFAAKKYEQAQSKAISRASRLPKW